MLYFLLSVLQRLLRRPVVWVVAGQPSCPGVCQGTGVQRGQCQQGSALALLYTVLGRQAHQKSLHSCIPALFSWVSWPSLCHFSVSCRSARVLMVFLYWQYWFECSECLSCWTRDWGRQFSSHLLLRSKRKAAFSTWNLKAWKSLTTKLKTQSKRFSNAQELERSVAFICGVEREVLSIWLRQSGVGGQGRSWKITQWEGAVRELQNSCHVSLAFFILGTDAVRQREGEWVSMYFCCCLCICAYVSEGVTSGVPV